MNETKNRKWLIPCLCVLGAAILITTIFLLVMRLDKPLFLKNHLNFNWNRGHLDSCLEREFTIQYLSNAEDSRMVSEIEFPDIQNDRINFYATESANSFIVDSFFSGIREAQPSTAQKLGMYALHSVRITVQYTFAEGEDLNIVLQNALIRFNDGTKQMVNLGEIQIHCLARASQEPASRISSTYSSNGTSKKHGNVMTL